MLIVRKLLVGPLVLLLLSASSVNAGAQHVVTPNELAAAVAEHVAARDADRASVAEALARPEVRQVAETMGVDLSRINDVAAALDGAELERAANAARQVNAQLSGGASTVVISTTTIIIILLLIILLVVALK